jgi:Mg2+/Co2+ transporter CorC
VVELLLFLYHKDPPNCDDTEIFLTKLENICHDKKLQKVSRSFLDIIMTALNFSELAQADEVIALLKEIENNEKLSTHNENIIIECDEVI